MLIVVVTMLVVIVVVRCNAVLVMCCSYLSPVHLPATGGDGEHQQPDLCVSPHPGDEAGPGWVCWVSPAGRGL